MENEQTNRRTALKVLFYIYMCFVCLQACMLQVCLVTLGGKKRVVDPLELGLEIVVSVMWVLGADLGSSMRAASALTTEPSF